MGRSFTRTDNAAGPLLIINVGMHDQQNACTRIKWPADSLPAVLIRVRVWTRQLVRIIEHSDSQLERDLVLIKVRDGLVTIPRPGQKHPS